MGASSLTGCANLRQPRIVQRGKYIRVSAQHPRAKRGIEIWISPQVPLQYDEHTQRLQVGLLRGLNASAARRPRARPILPTDFENPRGSAQIPWIRYLADRSLSRYRTSHNGSCSGAHLDLLQGT